MDFFIRDNCRLCNSKNLQSVIKLEDTPPANAFVDKNQLDIEQAKYPLELFICQDCSHLQLTTVVNPKKLFENYVYVSGTSPIFIKHFEDCSELIIKKYIPNKKKLVIDIGSNDGTLLKFYKDKGFNILGIDPAKAIAKEATEKGINTIPKFFNQELAKEILTNYGDASIISANNVFAHSDNLKEIIQGVKELLCSDGLFIFEVSYLVDVFEKSLFDTIYHEHLAYHSVLPLINFFKKNEMELIDVQRIPTHGGSIRGIVQKLNGKRKVEESIKSILSLEDNLGINKYATLVNFSRKISEIKNNLTKLLKEIKGNGKTIAGFGAPAKATTLMYQFGIDSKTIDFIVDDNPLKQGKFTPGLKIPVLPSTSIKEKKPDYLLILAWNFAEPIIKNHSYFFNQNGRFIVPLPEVKVI